MVSGHDAVFLEQLGLAELHAAARARLLTAVGATGARAPLAAVGQRRLVCLNGNERRLLHDLVGGWPWPRFGKRSLQAS